MFTAGAERAYVARVLMSEVMAYHLVLPLETLSTLTSWAIGDWAVVWPIGAVYVYVRAVEN
jgi:hypothetical protein